MRATIQLLLVLFTFQSVWTQQFDENTDINLTGIIYGEATWINTDNNAKKELFIAGYDTNYDNFSGIYSYQNNNLGLLSNSIEAYAHANIEQLDYNNDGYIDIIINGYNANDNEEVRLLLNNNDGSFSEQILPIDATSTGNMAIADLNNDNLSDIIITGVSPNDSDYIAKVYMQDNEGVFNERASSLFGNSFGDILVFDANNDGNNDVLITGFNNSYNPDTKLYLNDGNATFTENENANIMGIYFSATNAIDYDNDGDLDLVVSGFDTSYTPFSALYDNDGNGNFSLNSQPNLMALYWGAADFVDYDNDGDYDIFLTGADSNTTPHAVFYKNTNGNFTKDETTSNLVSGTYISSTDWSDFDNDGDLDLVITGLGSSGDAISKVYNNTQNQLNTTTFNTIDSLTLYPNPVTNGKVQFSFSLSQSTEPFLITIFSTDGKRVLSIKQNLNKSIDVSQLQKGIYMLQLSNIKQTVSKKLIIN